jgi:NADH:ubiquinone reductase (H+-translocating)
VTEKNAREGVTSPDSARVVVVGGGFAGGSFLRNLPAPLKRPGETLLVERGEDYAFLPLIHEVAVGRIHPDSVLTPIAPDSNAPYTILRGEATDVDLENNTLLTSSGPIKYSYLVLAPGSVAIPPPEGLSGYFHTFWSLADALRLRDSLNEAWRSHVLRKESLPIGGLTVAIVGGGATGVELAAEIAVLFDYLKRRSARAPGEDPRVVLLEATERLMRWLPAYFHEVAIEELSRLKVEVRLNAPVTGANEESIEIDGERLPAATRVWATGVLANPLVRNLPGEHDDSGRILLNDHLALPDYPEVYVLGDSGVYEHPRLGPLPPTASVAVQQGPYLARELRRRLRGVSEKRRRPFEFLDRGYVVSLGPQGAVADPLGVKLKGRAAQALYRSIFLYYMKSSRGRFLTGADWVMEQTLGRVGFDLNRQPGLPSRPPDATDTS